MSSAQNHDPSLGGGLHMVTGDRTTGGFPGGETAIEDADISEARPAQGPPGAGGLGAAGVVIDDHRAAGVDPPAPGVGLQVHDPGQGTLARGLRGLAREIRRQMDGEGARDARTVCRRGALFIEHVEQHDRAARRQQISQAGDGDEGP